MTFATPARMLYSGIMTTTARTMTYTPHAEAIGMLPAGPFSCRHCGDDLYRAVFRDLWTWHDSAGSPTGRDADLRHLPDPYQALNDLAARDDYQAACDYALLKVRLDIGLSFHMHDVRSDDLPGFPGVVPYHCDGPMWLRPSGWQCRTCDEWLS